MNTDPRLITRRGLIWRLPVLPVAASKNVSGAAFRGAALHHVSIHVTDLARSSEFYRRVFGLAIENRPDGTVRLALGRGSIVLRRGTPSGIADHFAIGIDSFDQQAVIQDLKSRGATPVEGGDAGLHVKDPDGMAVQLTDHANYLHEAAASAFAGSSLNHVSVYVRDVNRSAAFYESVFGGQLLRPANVEASRIGYVSFGKTYVAVRPGDPAGQADHFAIGINATRVAPNPPRSRGLIPSTKSP